MAAASLRVGASQPGAPTRGSADFVHLVLLRDLTPPWVRQPFPQALPGDSLLSQFTRPSFLCWPECDADMVFGSRVSGLLRESAARVRKQFAGAVARPLYQCTEVVDGHMCSNVASMSRFMDKPRGRPPYRCRGCAERAKRAGDAPGSASASLRVLWAYPMVEDPEGQPTPLHVTEPVRLLLHAPPPTWRWTTTHRAADLVEATPAPVAGALARGGRRERLHAYTEAESDALWLRSEPFKAQPLALE